MFVHLKYLRNIKATKQKQYVEDNEIDSDDELEEPTNFYYLPINEWKRDKTENLDREDNWHNHMKEKNWFTKEMENYLNNETK